MRGITCNMYIFVLVLDAKHDINREELDDRVSIAH